MPEKPYTAAQIARAIGRSKRAVLLTLADVTATDLVVNGGMAKAWPLTALPQRLREALATIAQRAGCRDEESLLRSPPKQWEPPVPLNRVGQRFLGEAAKRRTALADILARQHVLPSATFKEFGLSEYRKVFGHDIGERSWRRLVAQVIQRDGGAEDWQNLALYVRPAAFQLPVPTTTRFCIPPLSETVDEILAVSRHNEDANKYDRPWLFHGLFQAYERLLSSPENARAAAAIKRTLVCETFKRVPHLATSVASLKRVFEIKLKQWRDGGRRADAIEDKRPLKSGWHRRVDFKEDREKIRNLAVELDGNESLAHTMLRESGALSTGFCEHYRYDARKNKSALPRTVRQDITREVDSVLPLRHSQRAHVLAGPYVRRDWSDVIPGDWFTADDVTWNHAFKVRDPDGRWNWRVGRGECLLMTDAKSDYPISALLIDGHYNGEHIVKLIARAHDEVGLPRKGFLFERGVWNSRLVQDVGKSTMPWRETEGGLNGRGFDIQRSYLPRSKTIESCLGRLQERMRCLPGFLGFNEQVEKREEIQNLVCRARRGDPEAVAFFPSQEEWLAQIQATLEDFAKSPQNGHRITGQSPVEAWHAALHDHPLPKLTDETRYLLATHCKRVRIRNKGIVMTIRGLRRLYANEHTGQWCGREVWAFYNTECPELLTVSDLAKQHFFAVKELVLPAVSATREQLAEVAKAKRAHLAPAKAIFAEIQHAVRSNITRDDATDEATKDLGHFHNEAVEEHKQQQSADARKRRRIQQEAAAIGVSVGSEIHNPDRVLDGIEWVKEIRERIAKNERGGT